MLAFAFVSSATLESVHLDSLLSLIKNRKNGASVSLPDKKRASVIDGVLVFGGDTRREQVVVDFYTQLGFGFNTIDCSPFAIEVVGSSEPCEFEREEYSLYSHATLSIESIDMLRAQNRSEGQTIRDGGMNKKIKKMMCDKHVPLHDRDLLPLIACGGETVYVPLCAVADSAKPKKNESEGLIRINVYKRSSEV